MNLISYSLIILKQILFYEGLLCKEKETIFLEETEDCSDLKVFTKQ